MVLKSREEIAAVVIPIYKSVLNQNEITSLRQCLLVLGNHPIVFVAPEHLDCASYLAICAEQPVEILRFDDRYFADIQGYNRLMLSVDFYECFLTYAYILIYQLDAFVFRDDLLYWCKQGYDYIGAPFTYFPSQVISLLRYASYKNLSHAFKRSADFLVGNGGLSLRKTVSFIKNLKKFHAEASAWDKHEDVFWSFKMPRTNIFFKIAPPYKALQFSFETTPRLLFELNKRRLPFGCHAWEKYETEFWSPHFEELGYQIE